MEVGDAASDRGDLPYDAVDPEANAKASHKSRKRKDERKKALQAILSARPGRELFWGMMSDTGLFQHRVIVQGEFANGFQSGRRDVGESIMRLCIQCAPDAFALMLAENDK